LDQRAPLVSIGLPTYNGGRHLAQSLDALLAQDYPNWELTISDNGSTDETESIAREYAARCPQIRYVRQEKNLGARANFNFVLGRATGEYFMWASDHDQWKPTFITKCVEALRSDPAAVLAYTTVVIVDEKGDTLEEVDDGIDFRRCSAATRYNKMLWAYASKVYGLSRREAMAATGGFSETLSPDRLVLVQLALLGDIKKVDGRLYSARRNRSPETSDETRLRTIKDLDPARASELSAKPGPVLYRDLRDKCMQLIAHSRLSPASRLHARLATLYVFHMRYHVPSNLVRVLRGIAMATRQVARLERAFGKVALGAAESTRLGRA